MKKKYISCVILLSACLFTGCGAGIELTDEENNMVAEYMAGALLKYDHGYKEALVETADNSLEENNSKTEQKDNNSTDDMNANHTKDNKDANTTDSDNKNINTKNEAADNYSLNDLFAKKQYSLSYKNSILCSSYPEKENGYFNVEARPGQKLAVIHLDIKNISGKTKKIDLSQEGIAYTLELDGKTYDKPLLTGAMNDVQYFSDTITSGKSKAGVLIFGVDKKSKLSNGKLSISVNKKTTKIKL